MDEMILLGIKIVAIILGVIILFWIIGFRIIPNDKVGIVEKWWSTKGSLKEQIIALKGEAGYQPALLRGGIHFRTPFIYKVHIVPLVTIPQGKIAYVFARDGKPLEATQTLGKVVKEGNNFQNVRGFIENGGQKGPQRGIIREGTYAFNLAQFVIITENKTYYLKMGSKQELDTISTMSRLISERRGFEPVIIEGNSDLVGIVTVHDGQSLGSENIICPIVGDNHNDENYHNNFQDIDAFLRAGGYRGRQYQVLADGTYFINRLFATVEYIPKIIIPVGFVGVVVSYTGSKGEDFSGSDYKHGELVKKGYRGVWNEPLMPGKYAFNTYAGNIIKVPTTNVILKWISNQNGSHKYDENLKEVNLITKDAFEPTLPLSVVFHIDYRKAPLVIQRFGDIKMLVDQTLDPMVSAYFKNIGQTKTLIELIQQRNEIQAQSSLEMRGKFEHYNLELEEVLIGTPGSSKADTNIETILTQLRSRQIAKEQLETYETQQRAAEKEKELREAEAIAKQQTTLTESDINIRIQENQGKAELMKAKQDAEKIQNLSEAEAYKVKKQSEAEAFKIKITAEADADKEARVGISKAIAAKEQVNAYGGPQYKVINDVMTSFTNAIKEGSIDIVPRTLINTGTEGESKGSNAFESLVMLLLSEKLTAIGESKSIDESEDILKIKEEIMNNLKEKKPTELEIN
ncbi:SPFH domain-containing protein [Clostridium tertium]|uniref:SPFH domain-containing protein n=1 Tax=Clostridium TaxID=1485 RepID=UPI00232C1200|nr:MULTISPECIES: SPFH domain-containing protein [Clostridium]MDB1923966.1 SPFH domain-containing protein [Clostridium tertium]MDB1927097.1 SPFH domain-containing protein [Clostridium tertium]MDB1930809.1 SPFH domain-containing protein [Clostridium tertium]MDU1278189.1 SPFH domain-containing protein [Clostridium sp.]MDU7088206.1 SPFH domain-containing protein [Clostridium sp.]